MAGAMSPGGFDFCIYKVAPAAKTKVPVSLCAGSVLCTFFPLAFAIRGNLSFSSGAKSRLFLSHAGHVVTWHRTNMAVKKRPAPCMHLRAKSRQIKAHPFPPSGWTDLINGWINE